MTTLVRPLATVAALLLLLTYLVLRGTVPDVRRQEQDLGLVDSIILDQAALERDALKVRAGLLANYDPLVDTIMRLRAAARQLRTIEAAWPQVHGRTAMLDAAIREQEPVVEAVKTNNALVHNSLAYFTYLVRDGAGQQRGLDLDLADLVIDMLRYTNGADHPGADELAQELALLAARAADRPGAPEGPIATHGRRIFESTSVLDASLAALLRSPVDPTATALRAALVELHREQDRKATIYHVLLYVAAILLLCHLSFLYLRLRRNVAVLGRHAVTLESQSAYQTLVRELSTSFIGMPPERIDRGIEEGLARLGRELSVDSTYLAIAADGGTAERVLAWPRDDRCHTAGDAPDLLGLLDDPAMLAHECDGLIAIRATAELPAGRVRNALEERGVRAWLGVPLWHLDRPVGLLGLEVGGGRRAWQAESLHFLRLAGDIFAHALERQRSEAEREALTGRLARAERMEAIGTLAGGIAHNFNNILGAILGYAEMARDTLDEGSRSRRYVEEVRKAGTRAKVLVDQILTFGRRSERRRMPVRLAPLMDETIGLLAAVLPATVTVLTECVEKDATVIGDPAQIQQIVANLCTNAAQAMNGVGRIELVAAIVEQREEHALSHGKVGSGRYVRLAVADQGPGMDEATLARIFEPFFTTKLAGRGTGLGLATVHGIVADHDGALNVSSLPGQRTVFEVYLPAVEPPPPTPMPSRGPGAAGAGQAILLVDDEETLVLLGEEMLAALGYEPIGVTDPLRALELLAADPTRFDLVLSDEVMPGMLGNQLASRIAEIRPDLPILLMTGYGGLVAGRRPEAANIREILHKPLVTSELAAALRRQLEPTP